MNLSDALSAVSQVGFPIAVTAYLLLRFERKLDELRNSNDGLKAAVYKLCDALNKSNP